MDHGKIKAELDVLREFIDFVNRQVGVYCDCLSGFQGNKVRIERQCRACNGLPAAVLSMGNRSSPGQAWKTPHGPTSFIIASSGRMNSSTTIPRLATTSSKFAGLTPQLVGRVSMAEILIEGLLVTGSHRTRVSDAIRLDLQSSG